MVVSGEIKKKQTGATRVCVCVVYVYIYRYIANYSYGSIIIQNKLYAGMCMCVYVYIYIITVVVFCACIPPQYSAHFFYHHVTTNDLFSLPQLSGLLFTCYTFLKDLTSE